METSREIKLFDIPKNILNDNERQRRVYSGGGISPTILARTDSAKIMIGIKTMDEIYNKAINCTPKDSDIILRKLTPKECWRLMGFSDDAFERAEKVNSNTQLYKQAGNSIVVDVLMAIFNEML